MRDIRESILADRFLEGLGGLGGLLLGGGELLLGVFALAPLVRNRRRELGDDD